MFQKHAGELLDPTKPSDLVIIAEVLKSTGAIQQLVKDEEGRDVLGLVSRLPRDQQRVALPNGNGAKKEHIARFKFDRNDLKFYWVRVTLTK